MRKLALALTAATLVLGLTALTTNAQTQAPGVAGLHAQAQNFTPRVQKTACNGMTGAYGCGPGWVRRCWYGPYGGRHCACRPC